MLHWCASANGILYLTGKSQDFDAEKKDKKKTKCFKNKPNNQSKIKIIFSLEIIGIFFVFFLCNKTQDFEFLVHGRERMLKRINTLVTY